MTKSYVCVSIEAINLKALIVTTLMVCNTSNDSPPYMSNKAKTILANHTSRQIAIMISVCHYYL